MNDFLESSGPKDLWYYYINNVIGPSFIMMMRVVVPLHRKEGRKHSQNKTGQGQIYCNG